MVQVKAGACTRDDKYERFGPAMQIGWGKQRGRETEEEVYCKDQIRQHIHIRLCRVALQHQRHHVVLTRENVTELLSQAGCFLGAPVCTEPLSHRSELPLLVSRVPSLSMSSPFTPVPSTCCSIERSTQCPIAEVKDLRLGAGSFGGRESGGYSGKRVVSWEGTDVTMASVPKVLDGQSYTSTGEEMTQPLKFEGHLQAFEETLLSCHHYRGHKNLSFLRSDGPTFRLSFSSTTSSISLGPSLKVSISLLPSLCSSRSS
ncbi:hypothetical protein FQN60_006341, partial [Etheostoma spectabile]